jgi:hypothetical protein
MQTLFQRDNFSKLNQVNRSSAISFSLANIPLFCQKTQVLRLHIDTGLPGHQLLFYEVLLWKAVQNRTENHGSFMDLPRSIVHRFSSARTHLHRSQMEQKQHGILHSLLQ